MENKTKDGIEVKVGQLWRDLDKRMNNRIVKIYEVRNGFAFVKRRDKRGVRMSRISVKRMHNHSTGFALVDSRCEKK